MLCVLDCNDIVLDRVHLLSSALFYDVITNAQMCVRSSYHNIMTTYYDTAGPVLNQLAFGGWAQYTSATGDPYGLGR